MLNSIKTPRLHLFSGICLLMAGVIFFVLAFQTPNSHRMINLLPASLFILGAMLQILAYIKKRRA
jgi:uncharacterized membrane protein HdeD (DUF308 family)